jgi:serine/threonine-protein kinase
MLEALDYAHGRGVFTAIPFRQRAGERDGVAKVGDFGVARRAAADERGDIDAAARIVDEVLGGAKLPAARYSSVREYLEALRGTFKPKGIAGNLDALRRAIKAQPAKEAVSGTKRRLPAVLFVDDEERVTNALSALFDGTYDVATASSGAAALERLKEKRFLVVVSDQRMPGMTGVELLRQAKALAPNTVRLLLTGYSDLAAIVGSVNDSEVFRFVSKPWQQDELQATLGEAVSVAIALEAAGARGGAAPKSGAAVLGWRSGGRRAPRANSAGAFPVLEAAGSVEALELLSARTSALVCDLDAGSETLAAPLRVKRGAPPQTQLVVTSNASTPEQIIGLINEAHPPLPSPPVNLRCCSRRARLGARAPRAPAQTPDLARSERAGQGQRAARTFLARIKALGGRFARATVARGASAQPTALKRHPQPVDEGRAPTPRCGARPAAARCRARHASPCTRKYPAGARVSQRGSIFSKIHSRRAAG